MINWIAIVIILTISLIGCKQDKTTSQNAAETEAKTVVQLEPFANMPGPATEIDLRERAQSILDYRKERAEKPSWPIIESGAWEFAFVYDGTKMNRPSEQVLKWIDFAQDGTFEYGEGPNVVTKGQYLYDFDKGELIIIDDDKRAGPNMWKVNMNGGAMVLLGNTELASNAYQIKMDKLERRPQ